MKKLLFVINTLGTAGAEKALIELLNNLLDRDLEIDLLVIMNQGELIKEIPEKVNVINKNFDHTAIHGNEGQKHLIKHTLKNMFRNGAVFTNIPYLFREFFKMVSSKSFMMDKLLWKTMAAGAPRIKKEYDLAVAYQEGGAAYYVAKYVKAHKKATFIHIAYGDAGYTRSLDGNCFQVMDKIFGVSDEVKEEFIKVYPELAPRVDVFHNMLNLNRIEKKGLEEGGFEDDFDGTRILTVGRLTKQKAFEVSIGAMSILKSMGHKVRWYVLGEGDQRDFLESEIERLGLKEDFLLLGNRQNPYPYYKQCDLYIHASKFEGKSIAIQEAQIMGKPIIATDCNGNREQIDSETDGLLCRFTSEDVAEAADRLLKDKNLADSMGIKAKEKIKLLCENSGDLNKLLVLLY